MIVEVDVRRKTYQAPGRPRFAALENVRLTLGDGEFVCLVGPSGCGKSTLLQLMSGLDGDYEGSIRFDPPVSDDAPLAYVFQSARLMPWMSVLENVRLVACERSLAEHRAETLLEVMGLADVSGTYPNRLSGGMQRRVSLARAFVNRPRYLLLDEPFVSLDAPVVQRLQGLLQDFWAETSCTILFVTHDLREALQLADRVVFMTRSPGQVSFDLRVDLPRPRVADSPEIERFRREILDAHPEILAGTVAAAEG